MTRPDVRHRGAARYLRGAVGVAGELLVTLGVVLGLFVGWQLVWTDVVADGEQSAVVSRLAAEFSEPEGADPADLGEAVAIVRIPRFGRDYARPLYEGTDRATLQRGIGHYPGTPGPGEIGNFAIAGHRTTYGKPFNRIAELRDSDLVIVETREAYFAYQVFDRAVVLPTQTEVVLPVPG